MSDINEATSLLKAPILLNQVVFNVVKVFCKVSYKFYLCEIFNFTPNANCESWKPTKWKPVYVTFNSVLHQQTPIMACLLMQAITALFSVQSSSKSEVSLAPTLETRPKLFAHKFMTFSWKFQNICSLHNFDHK